METDVDSPPSTVGLDTKIERDFISPLTAIRGALEILRDYDDLNEDERRRFACNGLAACNRLEAGVEDLAKVVYAAGQRGDEPEPAPSPHNQDYLDRIHLDRALQVAELDFSDFEFSNSKLVNEFYDAIEETLDSADHRWWLLVNFKGCTIWPEAWIAFAHRGKRLTTTRGHGSVRYVESPAGDAVDPQILPSRQAAVAHIEALKTRKV